MQIHPYIKLMLIFISPWIDSRQSAAPTFFYIVKIPYYYSNLCTWTAPEYKFMYV